MNNVVLLGNVAAEAFATEDAGNAFCWRTEELTPVGYSPVIAGTLTDRVDVEGGLCVNGCAERPAFSMPY